MNIIHAIYGVFNLDFFYLVIPPFCISSHLKPIHIFLFGYISVLYPLFLVFLTWFCVELHGRNFQPLVWLWRPFHRCFVRLRRGWDTKSDIIDVFISFFLLSYGKCMYLTLIFMTNQIVGNYDEFGNFYNMKQRLTVDNSVTYCSTNHLLFAIPAVALFFIYNIILPVLLTLYPCKSFRSCLSKLHLNLIPVNILIDKVHSCYRNGLEGGRDLRSFSGLYFFLRTAIYLVNVLSCRFLREPNDNVWMTNQIWFPTGTVFMISALTVALIGPYQKNYMNYLDALLVSNLALYSFVIQSKSRELSLVFTRLLLFSPITILILIIFTRKFLKVSRFCKSYVLNNSLCLRRNFSLNLQRVADERVSIINSAHSAERDYCTSA